MNGHKTTQSMAPRRPLQPHGTTARAYGRPDSGVPKCTCDPCVAARRRYQNRRQAMHDLGHSGLVPSARAAWHTRALAEAGMTWSEITAAAGVSRGVLQKLLAPTGHEITILTATQQRLLAVPLPAGGAGGERRVDGVGTRRRLRALARLGWTCEALAPRLGVSAERVAQWRCAVRVTAATRVRVRALYEVLENSVGPSSRLAALAARSGWWAPAVWDGLDVDDPAAVPTVERAARRTEVAVEETEFLTSMGVPRHVIASQLGLSVDSLEKALARARVLEAAR